MFCFFVHTQHFISFTFVKASTSSPLASVVPPLGRLLWEPPLGTSFGFSHVSFGAPPLGVYFRSLLWAPPLAKSRLLWPPPLGACFGFRHASFGRHLWAPPLAFGRACFGRLLWAPPLGASVGFGHTFFGRLLGASFGFGCASFFGLGSRLLWLWIAPPFALVSRLLWLWVGPPLASVAPLLASVTPSLVASFWRLLWLRLHLHFWHWVAPPFLALGHASFGFGRASFCGFESRLLWLRVAAPLASCRCSYGFMSRLLWLRCCKKHKEYKLLFFIVQKVYFVFWS